MPAAEQLEIQSLAREFAASELRPRAAERDARGALEDEVFAQLAELGFLGMLVPEEHGGLGFDLPTYARVLEELAWGDAAISLSVAIHNGAVAALVDRLGSAAQRERWLPELASGRTLGALALAEAGTADDLRSLATRAEPAPGGWRLDGAKRWVTNGARAGLAVVVARPPEGGAAAFLVERGASGWRPGAPERTLGLRASETVGVELEGVSVDEGARLPAAGAEALARALEVDRLGAAAQAVGVARAAMEHAAEYALGRRQFDAPIASFGAIREKLGGMAQRTAAARALVAEAAAALQAEREGAEPGAGLLGTAARTAMARLAASEAAVWAADEAIQVFGGYGYMRHYPVEKLLRDGKGMEIYGGTNDVMREIVAREVLRDAGAAAEETT